MSTASLPATGLLKRSLGWTIAFSVLMIAAGILAIVIPLTGALAVTLIVAWLLVFSGAMHFVFAFHSRSGAAIAWELLVGIAYGFIGIYMLAHPLLGIESLTLALAIYLFAEAILEFLLASWLRHRPGWGWLIFDGIVTLVLAYLIWRASPSGSAWILGTLVGISMIFSGTSRLMMAMMAGRMLKMA